MWDQLDKEQGTQEVWPKWVGIDYTNAECVSVTWALKGGLRGCQQGVESLEEADTDTFLLWLWVKRSEVYQVTIVSLLHNFQHVQTVSWLQ